MKSVRNKGNSRVLTKICMVARLILDSVNAVERVWEGGKVEEHQRVERKREGKVGLCIDEGAKRLSQAK